MTVFSLVDESKHFFYFIGACAVLCAIASLFLKEPKGSFAHEHADDELESVPTEATPESTVLS